ncbi:hypothetical protein ROHU_011786 [Labeo rohita]|uniref:Uncharacterized protein n=1 Tax=Labeo rohita TaxID=84645 RepID=A0A498LHP3_LABRO|nr:hypothetical protein ROHU_011786 [Labeo rohita]
MKSHVHNHNKQSRTVGLRAGLCPNFRPEPAVLKQTCPASDPQRHQSRDSRKKRVPPSQAAALLKWSDATQYFHEGTVEKHHGRLETLGLMANDPQKCLEIHQD